VERAELFEVKWDANQRQFNKVRAGNDVSVQFNPQTLKVSFSNQNRGGDQPGGSSRQFVGSGTSRLDVELLFDTTADGSDVRKATEKIAFFIKAKPDQNDRNNRRVPPVLSFEWGTFIFRGNVESIGETLDYFSEEGVPLRATISLNISRQEIEFVFGQPGQGGGGGSGGAGGAPGQATGATSPLAAARPGDNLQSLAARNGSSADWKAIAAANNIDDPLRLNAGALIDINAGANVKVGISVKAGASAGAGVSAGVGISSGAGATAQGPGVNVGATLSLRSG